MVVGNDLPPCTIRRRSAGGARWLRSIAAAWEIAKSLLQAEVEDPHSTSRDRVAQALVSIVASQGPRELPESERQACRKQVLELLSADLAALGKLVASEGPFVHRTIQSWLVDTELAAVRDLTALERLLPEERRLEQTLDRRPGVARPHCCANRPRAVR
jgi:hypothetical protein